MDIALETILPLVFVVRKVKVMVDTDLAELYGVETKALNQAVKRNAGRFPADFMFQLNDAEFSILKSQNVTSRWGGASKPSICLHRAGHCHAIGRSPE